MKSTADSPVSVDLGKKSVLVVDKVIGVVNGFAVPVVLRSTGAVLNDAFVAIVVGPSDAMFVVGSTVVLLGAAVITSKQPEASEVVEKGEADFVVTSENGKKSVSVVDRSLVNGFAVGVVLRTIVALLNDSNVTIVVCPSDAIFFVPSSATPGATVVISKAVAMTEIFRMLKVMQYIVNVD
ncbi:unnamed protein product [Enterobius vermicularis]|uniref:ACT_7 domain-containing protein n=1 Tax=Enterobius vermicularis TaxID=51028 RepID=A0A0N4VGD3_ENTVE|nr:unnamed protein product [Enterobius vermicularis]